MLKGGSAEKVWQPISQLIWVLPRSFSISLMALNTGRSGQPVQKVGGRGGIGLPRYFVALVLRPTMYFTLATAPSRLVSGRPISSIHLETPVWTTSDVYWPAIGNGPLPCTFVWTSALRRMTLTSSSI